MPTYEYECTSCGHRVEVFQRLSEDPLTICERCDGRLRKLFHPVGISFRGSGFYTTDSRKAPSRSGEGKKETSKEPASGSSKGAKDSKKPTEKSA